MLKIGHRGAKGHEPENTLASIAKAIQLGVDAVELDVHLSADGQIVVIHDETVNRTTHREGIVNQMSWTELKKLRIDGEHTIPLLSEVFDLVNRRIFINVELKGEGTAQTVVGLIQEYINNNNWDYSHFLVSSFDWNALQEVHRLDPKIALGVLTLTDIELAVGFAEFIHARSIHPYFHLLTRENTTQMQRKGFEVFPWTVNEPEDLEKIKSFHVSGIISDFPERI